MKKYCFFLVLIFVVSISKATVHTISLSSSGITPSTVNATVGDTINWVTACSCAHTTTSTTIPGCATAWNHVFPAVTGSTYSIVVTCSGTYNYVNSTYAYYGVINVATTTGIESLENSNLLLTQNFPNPFTETTVIKYKGNQTATKLVITDLQGRTVSQQSLNNLSGEITLAENFLPGTYFYSIYAGDILLARNKMIAQ